MEHPLSPIKIYTKYTQNIYTEYTQNIYKDILLQRGYLQKVHYRQSGHYRQIKGSVLSFLSILWRGMPYLRGKRGGAFN